MILIANRVGRLVEIRHLPPGEARDFDEAAATRFVALLESIPGAVMCLDLRRTQVLPAHLAKLMPDYMKRAEGHFEAAAYIASLESPTLFMQIRRLVSQTANPTRRVFSEAAAAIDWLDEKLDANERRRVRAFLAEADKPGG